MERDELEGASIERNRSKEKDKLLIMINISTVAITKADQKKTSFWGKVARNFSKHALKGVLTRMGKTSNACWNKGHSLLSEWTRTKKDMSHLNPSGSSMEIFCPKFMKRMSNECWRNLTQNIFIFSQKNSQIGGLYFSTSERNIKKTHSNTSTPGTKR